MNYTCPQCTKTQRGVALLVALLVVALAAVLIAALLDRGELSAARTRNQLRAAQAQAYAQGLEAYAARVLQQDAAGGGKVDTAGDAWAVPLPPTPVPGGEITATMSDLDGRFNLNNLSPDYAQHVLWEKKFRLLLQALKLEPNLALVVHDWMSRDVASGSNDAFYLSQAVPYRSAKNVFFHISELRLLRGMSGDAYAQLAPHVSALPAGTTININTASVPVLMTLRDDMTQQMAQALWQQGHANFRSLADIATAVPNLQPDCPPPAACYDVYSRFFVARGQITLDGLPFVFYSVLDRIEGGADGGIHVIQRSRGTEG